MKEITVENFSNSNIKEWIKDYSHKEKVEFAVYCAELVIDLHTGSSEAPNRAIQAAKNWILNPSEENRQKCKATAYATDDAAAYVAAAAAGCAAYDAAAYAADCAADYAACAADAAAYAAYAANAAYAGKSTKDKIISYINNKLISQTKEVEWVNGDKCIFSGEEYTFGCVSPVCDQGYVVIFDEVGDYHGCYIGELSKPETKEDREKREELEAAYDLYCYAIDLENPFDKFRNFGQLKDIYIKIVRKTGYRKGGEAYRNSSFWDSLEKKKKDSEKEKG